MLGQRTGDVRWGAVVPIPNPFFFQKLEVRDERFGMKPSFRRAPVVSKPYGSNCPLRLAWYDKRG